MADLARTVEKLCAASPRDPVGPYAALDWSARIGPDEWCTSPELVSLYGTDVYAGLTEGERRRLSFFEAVNFFSLNIHGEKALVEGLARRLYQEGDRELTPYLHHFLDEENRHMACFGRFCLTFAGKIYPDRHVALTRDYAPGEEGFLFFAKVLVFEEIVDVYNRRMSRDGRLPPLVRRIHELHHRDEARHLAFGRQLVKQLFDRYAPEWPAGTLRGVRDYLGAFLVATWKAYYNPDVYRDAGLARPHDVHAAAFGSPRCRRHRQEVTAGCLRYLVRAGILEEAPSW